MNPNADTLWRAPRWALAILLAVLGMLGPFSIDTYLPAFSGIARSLGATPVQMQQTLSAYLFGFAFMNLFHGALSDSIGRRPVVLWGIAAFFPPIWNRVIQPRLKDWDLNHANADERALAREANRRAGWPDWLGEAPGVSAAQAA